MSESGNSEVPRSGKKVFYLEKILEVLRAEGPQTVEDLRRHLMRAGHALTRDAVRKSCMSGYESSALNRSWVKSKKYRVGIYLWSHKEESPEKLAAKIAEMSNESAHNFYVRKNPS